MSSKQNQADYEAHIHYIAAFIGGFLVLFPIVNAAHLLGSAQTSNLIDIVLGSLKGEWKTVLLHALGAFIYAFAVFLATFLPKHAKVNIQILSMIFDALCAVVMWRFPSQENLPAVVYLYPTFFVMPFQWCAFKGAYGFTSSTIFSSNNFRQFISALTEIFFNGDNSYALKAKFFGTTLLAFHLGIGISYILWKFFGKNGFLFAIVPALTVLFIIFRKESVLK
ncbi:YoaK family protein [Treponema sp.]|uniref:YoaK family protein n=1 Tax=Treponema sp. TaxID=166 RepID=UPI00388E4B69